MLGFLFGLAVGGAATASGGLGAQPFVSGIPAECLLVETEFQYRACRIGSMTIQSYDPAGRPLCYRRWDAWEGGSSEKAHCDFHARMSAEWKGLQRLAEHAQTQAQEK